MASLMHNQTIRMSNETDEGLYRVVINDVSIGLIALVRLDTPAEEDSVARSKTQQPSPSLKKKTAPLCGELLWYKSATIDQDYQITLIEIERENFDSSPSAQVFYEHRKKVMVDFLDLEKLHYSIMKHKSIGGLTKVSIDKYNGKKGLIYKCWSMLCRYGFTESSLRPLLHRCGAPGVAKDCSPNGRKKAGRKTNRHRLAQKTGASHVDVQPGMSAAWRQVIMIADRKISSPKPKFGERYQEIIKSFTKHYKDEGGKLKSAALILGEYPNESQVRRVLNIEVPHLQRIRDLTTQKHFERSKRPLIKRNWKGVSGPGHTWAIDSTRGDIYLRSSINRAWIIGRPIVYIVVDVWSTAIVGFYVCLRGPSWETATVALFNAAAPSSLFQSLWGFEPMLSLNPFPTLPSILLCDRGEYLSFAAKETALKLIDRMSYTPPYRPDLKGLVEVLHRITKDHQAWVPGAIDARRAEYELRKFDPNKGIFTVREYVAYLHNIFMVYNLTADRRKRLDAMMIADDVPATPAGLWNWGHQVGIGFSRYKPQSELIERLLPTSTATVTRSGIYLDKLVYESDITNTAGWTGLARNRESWDIPCHHYPGSVSRIWTPNLPGEKGLLELTIMDQANASATQTYEEVADAFAYEALDLEEKRHEKQLIQNQVTHANEQLVSEAKAKTQEAIERNTSPKPTMTEARGIEVAATESVNPAPPPAQRVTPPADDDESNASYAEMLKAVMDAKRS